VDWAAGERGVLSAVIEMQVRIGDRHHVVGVDPTCAKQLRQVADDRPVLLLDLRAAEADPRVEEQHSVGMDYRVSHHGTRQRSQTGERARWRTGARGFSLDVAWHGGLDRLKDTGCEADPADGQRTREVRPVPEPVERK